ncbi:MAG TPA: hypothetical protein VMO88_14245, partial [Acidimicrobiales bacterium]|nr:hypothetical protein [Acidimicrobiales bacterium]
LRGLRRQSRLDSEAYRPLLLSAVYKSAVDHVHSHATPTPAFSTRAVPKGKGAHSKGANAALLEAAFRSLPERWRAAVWLGDAEGMEAERIAPVLGVSAAVATQLLTRGRRGLAGRFAQAHRPEPDHLGSALRAAAVAVPASLADETAARWRALVSDPGVRLAPLTGWLNERAVRPLWVSVGGLMGLGLIGLGIVGQNSSVNNGPVATGSLPAANAPGITPLSNRGGLGGLAGGIGTIAPNSGLNPFLTGSGGGAGNGASTTFGNTPGSGLTGPGSGSGSPTGDNGSVPNTGGSPPPPPPPVQANTVFNSPVASVTTTGPTGSTSLNLNTAPTGPVATATVCSSQGVGLTVGGQNIGCAPAGPAPAPSTTPQANPGAVGTSNSTSPTSGTSSVTKTITNTVTGVPGL